MPLVPIWKGPRTDHVLLKLIRAEEEVNIGI
jgi:hypothetical protein